MATRTKNPRQLFNWICSQSLNDCVTSAGRDSYVYSLASIMVIRNNIKRTRRKPSSGSLEQPVHKKRKKQQPFDPSLLVFIYGKDYRQEEHWIKLEIWACPVMYTQSLLDLLMSFDIQQSFYELLPIPPFHFLSFVFFPHPHTHSVLIFVLIRQN